MADPLTRKLGPLPVWQWVAIGGGTGLLLYLYERNKAPAGEESASLAGSTNNPISGGGGGEGAQGLPVAGPIGEPGIPGPPGTPAAEISTTRLEAIEGQIERLNKPPTGKSTVAPQGSNKFPLTNPANGQKYKQVHEKGKTVHVYASGKRVVLGARPKTKAGHTAKPSHAKAPRLKVPTAAAHKAPVPAKKPAAKKVKARR